MGLLDSILNSQQAIDSGRLLRLEKKIDLLLEHFGIELEMLTDDVRSAADAGEKIQAIKLYREQTGVGLAEAKRDIEAYMDAR